MRVEQMGDPLWQIQSLIRRTEIPEQIARLPARWLPVLIKNSIVARTPEELAEDQALLDSIIQISGTESAAEL